VAFWGISARTNIHKALDRFVQTTTTLLLRMGVGYMERRIHHGIKVFAIRHGWNALYILLIGLPPHQILIQLKMCGGS
jgi:hypothetical protein